MANIKDTKTLVKRIYGANLFADEGLQLHLYYLDVTDWENKSYTKIGICIEGIKRRRNHWSSICWQLKEKFVCSLLCYQPN